MTLSTHMMALLKHNFLTRHLTISFLMAHVSIHSGLKGSGNISGGSSTEHLSSETSQSEAKEEIYGQTVVMTQKWRDLAQKESLFCIFNDISIRYDKDPVLKVSLFDLQGYVGLTSA